MCYGALELDSVLALVIRVWMYCAGELHKATLLCRLCSVYLCLKATNTDRIACMRKFMALWLATWHDYTLDLCESLRFIRFRLFQSL